MRNELSTNIWSSKDAFEVAGRMANALQASTVVPRAYQGNPGNCIIAIEMANRLNTSPLMVMQNLYVVNGNPSWSSQYIIAMINNSKRYKTELQFEVTGSGDSLACYAYTLAHDDRKVSGPLITMKMAKDEGWVGKNGSKWKTMPEMMIRYRAASFFGRMNCPDLIMGMYSVDEVKDGSFDEIRDVTPEEAKTMIKLEALAEEPEAPEESPQEVAKKELEKLAELTKDNEEGVENIEDLELPFN